MTREEREIIEAIKSMGYDRTAYPREKVSAVISMAIEALSERTGEWIFEKTDEYKRTYCSVCGGSAPFICVSDDYYGRRSHGETRKTDFCPNCGADMRGEEE